MVYHVIHYAENPLGKDSYKNRNRNGKRNEISLQSSGGQSSILDDDLYTVTL